MHCRIYYRMFNSLSSFLLNASGTPLVMTTENVSRHCQASPEETNSPLVGNYRYSSKRFYKSFPKEKFK